MPGTVSGVLGNTYLTYTPDAGEDPADYLSENNQFDVIDCYGDGETQRFTISSISGNTLNIDESLTNTVTTKQVVYDITGVATINFTKPSDKA